MCKNPQVIKTSSSNLQCHCLQMLWKAGSSQRSQAAATQHSWHYTKLALILPTLINFPNLMGIFPKTPTEPQPPELSVSVLTGSASQIAFSVTNSQLAGTASHSSRHSTHTLGGTFLLYFPWPKRERISTTVFPTSGEGVTAITFMVQPLNPWDNPGTLKY